MTDTATEDTILTDAMSMTDHGVHAWMAGAPTIQPPAMSVSPPLSVMVLDVFSQRKARSAPGEDLYLCRVTIAGQPLGNVYVNLRDEGPLAAAGRDYLFANRPA